MITQDKVGPNQFVKQICRVASEFCFTHQWYYTRTMSFTAKKRQYWENVKNESMPDKYILKLEINLIKKCLGPGKLLDVGCGEGDCTFAYSQTKGVKASGIDYANNRLNLARKKYQKIKFYHFDLTKKPSLGKYDYIVSQRFLINLANWKEQKRVIDHLINCLNPGGKLILCEGSLQGVKTLNQFRAKLKLEPIPIRWHNVFINDVNLVKIGFKLIGGFGGYFLLTRGVRPFFDQTLNWNSRFNRIAKNILLPVKYSRTKVWQYEA